MCCCSPTWSTYAPKMPRRASRSRSASTSDVRRCSLAAMPSTPPRLGRYELGPLLGEGGSGQVFDAVLLGPGGFRKPVALKVLREGARGLRREARLGGLLRHVNLVDVYEVGEVDGVWFCALERCVGRLSDHLPLPPRAVVEVGLQVCAALRYAHEELGLVHLDLKPDNLLYAEDGTVKVGDLGIATAEGFADEGVRGTPGYMSPEQTRGLAVDARSDVYALGRTLLELAVGDPRSAASTFSWSGEGEASGPAPESPDWLEPVLERCIAASPEDRFESMAALAAALRAVSVHGPSLADALGLAAARSPEERPGVHPPEDAFVGRQVERVTLALALRNPGAVVLKGPAGIGKSRLAAEVARDWVVAGHGHGWRCDLTDAQTREGLLFAMARALNVPLEGEDPVAQLGAAIAGRGPMVLLLDQVDRVRAHGDVLRELQTHAPELRLLLTSRRSLGWDDATELPLGPLSPEDAARLLAVRALTRGVDVADDPDLAALAAELDGLPLALELAAGRLGVLSVADVRERLGLGLLRRGTDDRHGTLVAALEWSIELLEPATASALIQLGVFAGGFALEAVEAVLDVSDPVREVGVLVEHSLVRGVGDRFELPLSVQAYVEQHPVQTAVQRRHAAYFAAFGSDAAWESLYGHGGLARRRRLANELDNLAVACRRAVAWGDASLAVGALRAARVVLDIQGPPKAARALSEAVAGLPLEGLDRARVLLLQALAQHHGGAGEGVLATLGEARAAFAAAGDRRGEWDCWMALGMAHRDLGEADVGRKAYEAALRSAEAIGHRRGAAMARSAIGLLVVEAGQLAEGRRLLAEAAWELGAFGDRLGQGRALSGMGIAAAQQGRLAEARHALERAVAVFREAGSRRDEAITLGNLANLTADEGRRDEAVEAYEAALKLHREVGHRRFEGVVLANLAGLLQELGQLDRARQLGEQALAVNRSVGDRRVEGAVLGTLGFLAFDGGDVDVAREHWEAALAVAREVGDRVFEAYWLGQLARLADTDDGLALLDQAEALARAIGAMGDVAELLALRAEVLHAGGRPNLARQALEAAERTCPEGHADVARAIARVRETLDDPA
ncbi:MAG: tetratricopeptide repeat protein [Deltaproteobacteria bacterium]|nr:MAG: tetratricopeptide repeat protein [Deltaproteobacteria bacterium]